MGMKLEVLKKNKWLRLVIELIVLGASIVPGHLEVQRREVNLQPRYKNRLP